MSYHRILFDIETQQDLFLPGGSLYTPQADEARRNIVRLFEWVRRNEIPVISTVLRIRRQDRGPLSARPHCIEDTDGEAKLPETILSNRLNLGLRNTTDLPHFLFRHHQQVVFEQRDSDVFNHARLERLITEITSATFIICGAGVAKGIVQAAVGLRTRGFGVILATDAIVALNDPLADMALRRMEAKGVVLAPTSEIIVPRKATRQTAFRAPQRVQQ